MSAQPKLTTDADAIELLRELVAEVKGLRADLAGRAPQADQATGTLVRYITEQSPGIAFSVAELLERAQVEPGLRAAIVAAIGALNGKKIGKLFRRIEGVDFDGVSIERRVEKETREGVSWCCDFRGFENRKPVAGALKPGR